MFQILKLRHWRAMLVLTLTLFAAASQALPLQLDFSGEITSPLRLTPNYPQGTPWEARLNLDSAQWQLVRRIPGYNATYYAPQASGSYALGNRSASVGALWVVVFDALPNGSDEIDFYGEANGLNMFSLWLADNTGRFWDGAGAPDLAQLTTRQFSLGKIAFDEDSPIVTVTASGAAPYGVIKQFAAHYAVPSPSSLSLLALGAFAIAGSIRRYKAAV